MAKPRRVVSACAVVLGSMVIVPVACSNPSVTGVSDITWSRKLSDDIVYGSVASGNGAISADVPSSHVRACVDGLVKGLAQQEAPTGLRASRRLAPLTDTLTQEMVRLLRETGSTFLAVDNNVYRFAVSNTRPYTFNCRTPLGTASFPLDARWARQREL